MKTMTGIDVLKAELLEQTAPLAAKYEQYVGHFDDWQVGVVKKALCWKGRKAYPMLASGDLVLVKEMSDRERSESWMPEGRYVTIFVRNHPCAELGMSAVFDAKVVEVMS